MAGSTQRPESDNKSKIRLLYKNRTYVGNSRNVLYGNIRPYIAIRLQLAYKALYWQRSHVIRHQGIFIASGNYIRHPSHYKAFRCHIRHGNGRTKSSHTRSLDVLYRLPSSSKDLCMEKCNGAFHCWSVSLADNKLLERAILLSIIYCSLSETPCLAKQNTLPEHQPV